MKKIAVFASGGGTNLQSIIDAVDSGRLVARVACVISNNSAATALERARRNGIPAIHLSERQSGGPEAYTALLLSRLKGHGAELIALAGYMKLLPAAVVRAFRGRILNIHPALLPKFGGQGMYGMRVHEAVLKAGEKESGATVHRVTEKYDEGEILLQKKVPVLPGDVPQTLAVRVLAVEHEIFPMAIQKALDGIELAV